MAHRFKYTPSRAKAREYAQEMDDIRKFCDAHGIAYSRTMDSYYFSVNGKSYRVSNHSVESSNAHAYAWNGEQIRQQYHAGGRDENTIYIHAGKTRIKEIYEDLCAGHTLDGRGNRK